MDTNDIIVLIGLVINIGLTIWNSIKLKEIEVFKAGYKRTNRKISYIHQSIRDLSENNVVFVSLIFDQTNESKIDQEKFFTEHIQRLSIAKGIIDGVAPFLGQNNRKKIATILDDYINDHLDNDLQDLVGATTSEAEEKMISQITINFSGACNNVVEILKDEINDLLSLEK